MKSESDKRAEHLKAFHFISKACGFEDDADHYKREYIKVIRSEATKMRYGLIKKDACCRVCGCTDIKNIELHHIVPVHLFGNNDPDNLISLCKQCHVMVHKACFPMCVTQNGTFVNRFEECKVWMDSLSVNGQNIVYDMIHKNRITDADRYKETIQYLLIHTEWMDEDEYTISRHAAHERIV